MISTSLIFTLYAFFFGACIGSFLNVCIYRMPLGKSVIRPGSHCSACGKPLPWYHNIPIASWLWLRGRAACCGCRIDARYPLVEILTAIGFAWIWYRYPVAQAIVYMIFFCGLVVATFVDIDHFIIPDEISVGGCVAGLALSTLLPQLHGVNSHWIALKLSAVGMVTGGIFLFAVAIIGALIFRKEAMGFGDVKLLAAMGAFLGWKGPFFIVALASVIGTLFGLSFLFKKGKMFGVPMPFGPCLAIAAIIWILGGKEWIANYLLIFQD